MGPITFSSTDYKTGICFNLTGVFPKHHGRLDGCYTCFFVCFPGKITGKHPTHFADVPSSPSILKCDSLQEIASHSKGISRG